ncbi:MAG: hypothetical protein IPK31_15855 [Chitinophagaceae bacterium]|nr:hypothetical protein [Chitinophagaceae bacterium]
MKKFKEGNMIFTSRFSKAKAIISYLLCFTTLVISTYNYNLNRPLFSGLIILLVFLFWITGFYEKIEVTNDNIVFENTHLIPFFKRSKKYKYSEIDSIELEGKLRKRDFLNYQYLSLILPGFIIVNNTIKVNLKSNTSFTQLSQISQEELLIVFSLLKQKSKNNFAVKISA